MSRLRLHEFLTKLDKELSTYKEYRKELNRQPHTFVFHKRTLLNETLKQLRLGNKMDLNKKDEAQIKIIVDRAAKNLVDQLRYINGGKLKSPGGKTTLVFDKDTNVPIPKYRDITLPYTAFSRVKFAYRGVMNTMFSEMQDYFRNHKSLETIKTKSGGEKKSVIHFFDAGHEKNAGVFERFLDTKTASIMAEINNSMDKDSDSSRDKLLAELKKTEGIDLQIEKIDDLGTIVIKIESASVNRKAGQKVGMKSQNIRKALKKYMETVELENLEGSDSLKEQKIKKTRNKVLDAFRDVPGATVSSASKVKKSNKKPVNKKVKTKATAKAASIAVVAKARKTKTKRVAKQSPASRMLQMIAMINKELPDTVRKNMNSPRLENRTGRFADSVKVTDVVQTPKGFPSIGYTYAKNPYQVYEMGAGSAPWASPERDPRRLIDASIREIAAQLAIGRFFTRRV